MALDPNTVELVRRFMLNTRIAALSSSQEVICVKDTATVEQAMKLLADNRILSAPIVTPPVGDESTRPDWPCNEGSCDISAFLDVRALLLSFLAGVKVDDMAGMNLLERVRTMEELGSQFAARKLLDLDFDSVGLDGDFLHTTQAKASLLELVMYGLLDPKRRGMHAGEALPHVVHRVALFDSKGRITNVISQTDIIHLLQSNKAALGPLCGMSVAQLGWHNKPVLSVTPELPAVEALTLMQFHNVSALAIVSPTNGRLLGNFSISEMRTMMAEHLGALALPVGEFLALSHKTEYVGYNRIIDAAVVDSAGHKFVVNRLARTRSRRQIGEEVGQALVSATPASTFADVLDLLVQHRAHRVYVVDEEEAPVGIVTCTDVLRKVVEVATCTPQ